MISVRGYPPDTRKQLRSGVPTAARSTAPAGRGSTEPGCHVRLTRGRAEGKPDKLSPHEPLKVGSRGIERQVERTQIAVEVGPKLADCFAEGIVTGTDGSAKPGACAWSQELKLGQGRSVGDQSQPSDRTGKGRFGSNVS